MFKPDLNNLHQQSSTRVEQDANVVKEHLIDGRIARWRELIDLGVSPNSLSAMVRRGNLERTEWGTYQLDPELRQELTNDSDAIPSEDDSNMYLEQFQEVTPKAPNGVICMMSAVAYHGLSLDVPHEVWLGIQHGRRPPKMDYPPVKAVKWRNKKALTVGVETKTCNGTDIPITNLERTVVDIYRYALHLHDPALPRKVLQSAMQKPEFDREKLAHYARTFSAKEPVRERVWKDVEMLDLVGFSQANEHLSTQKGKLQDNGPRIS